MAKTNKTAKETEVTETVDEAIATAVPEMSDIQRMQINLEYATRLLWLVVRNLGGEVVITQEAIDTATFDEVRVTDTVDGGLHIEAVKLDAAPASE